MTQLLPPKKEVALALLERSNVDVYLDPRAKGVVVPPQFRKEPRLILKIGLNMPVPIPDLRLDDESMSCTLSFNRSPFYCVVPWTSVFAMVGEDGRGMVWPDDVPQELAVKVVDPNDGAGRAPSADRADRAEAPRAAESAAAPRRGTGRGANRERLAGQTGEAAAERPSRGGKSKKKKKEEPGRPVLVAVPPSQREARSEAAGERSREISDISQAPDSRRPHPPHPPQGASEQRPRDGVSAIPSSRPRQPPSAGPPSARRPDGSIARPKRELPPYLRVVK